MLNLIGRSEKLFDNDIISHKEELFDIVSRSRFLVLGGAGSIGQAVSKGNH
jgi:putative NADH-flavin reductase